MFIKDGIAYAGTPVCGIHVTAAHVVNDLSMLVAFSNGETRLFDASHLLGMSAFQPLVDKRVFESFSLDHGVVCWLDGQIDVAPEAMYEDSYEYDGLQVRLLEL